MIRTLLFIIAVAVLAAGCGPPRVDARSVQGLPRAARAPAYEAERLVLAGERGLVGARDSYALADADVRRAAAAVKSGQGGQAGLNLARTRLAYLTQVRGLREAGVTIAVRRLALAHSRWELAKAHVVDDNSLPEAVGLDLRAFEAEAERAAAGVAAAQEAARKLEMSVAILKKALHSARVASLRSAGR